MITQALTEKLQLFADMVDSAMGPDDTASRTRLLLRGDAPDLQQGETLLKGAITEGRTVSHDVYSISDVYMAPCLYILPLLNFYTHLINFMFQLCPSLFF